MFGKNQTTTPYKIKNLKKENERIIEVLYSHGI